MHLENKTSPAASSHGEAFVVDGPDLLLGGIPVAALAADFGTPFFAYDAGSMRGAYRRLSAAVNGFAQVFYSVKANPNPAVIRVFVEEGAGLEIASGAEYLRARAAGAGPGDILFAGPGKGEDELERVIGAGIGEIHLESAEEMDTVAQIGASLGRRVPVAIRVNPSAAVQGGAMRMGGKPGPFGFDEEDLDAVVDAVEGRGTLDLRGIHLFAGTQILDAKILISQWSHALALARRVADRTRRPIASIDLGGGLGIPYHPGDAELDLRALEAHVPALSREVASDDRLRAAHIVLEPGRYLVGASGIYVVRVRAAKTSRGARFLVTDGGMHHQLAASGNLGQIVKRDYPIVAPARMDAADLSPCAVVGPLCTPLDTLARQARLPALAAGDLIGVLQSGAYGLTASPTEFLSHPTPPEILVDEGRAVLVRERQDTNATAWSALTIQRPELRRRG